MRRVAATTALRLKIVGREVERLEGLNFSFYYFNFNRGARAFPWGARPANDLNENNKMKSLGLGHHGQGLNFSF